MSLRSNASSTPLSQDAIDVAFDEDVREPKWEQLYSDDLDRQLARDKWRTTKSEIKKAGGHVNFFVGHQIKQLIVFYVLFESASRHIAEEGPILRARRTKTPIYNPWFSVLKDASMMINAVERKLGISQEKNKSDGSQAKTAKGRQPRAADAYLSRPHRLKGSAAVS